MFSILTTIVKGHHRFIGLPMRPSRPQKNMAEF
jgi:hypothetical protein